MSAPILDNDHITVADVGEALAQLNDSQQAMLVASIHRLVRPAKSGPTEMMILADVLERITRPAREKEARISRTRELAAQAAND